MLRGLLGDADAVVWSRGSSIADRVMSSRPRRWPTRTRSLTVTAITPFGLDGPWADKPATEFTRRRGREV